MTIKELIDKLKNFPDNLFVYVPNSHWSQKSPWPYVCAESVIQGGNEFDRCVIID